MQISILWQLVKASDPGVLEEEEEELPAVRFGERTKAHGEGCAQGNVVGEGEGSDQQI